MSEPSKGVAWGNWLVSKASGLLDAKLNRRSFIARTTLLGSAVAALKNAFTNKHLLLDHQLICRALSISRNEHAIEFLLDVVRTHRFNEALTALEALKLYRDSGEICSKIREAVARRTEPEIQLATNSLFPAN